MRTEKCARLAVILFATCKKRTLPPLTIMDFVLLSLWHINCYATAGEDN
jgi:hypothetical protein